MADVDDRAFPNVNVATRGMLFPSPEKGERERHGKRQIEREKMRERKRRREKRRKRRNNHAAPHPASSAWVTYRRC